MLQGDPEWHELVDGFATAALEPSGWEGALTALARATGSARGQLIGIGGPRTIPFNWVTDMPPRAYADFVEIEGSDPSINPRMAASLRARPLQTISEREYLAALPLLRSEVYRDYAAKYDIELGCQTTLVADTDMIIGLAVLRTRRDGPTQHEARALFRNIAPHVRRAVRVQAILEGQGAAVIAGALETMNLAAFVCDGLGLVRAMTAKADALVTAGDTLQIAQGRIRGACAAEHQALAAAITAAVSPLTPDGARGDGAVVLRGGDPSAAPMVVDILSLPATDYQFGFAPRVLVLVRGGPGAGQPAALLAEAFGLTGAEADVAAALISGRTRVAIAKARGVSEGTVRSQIKAIFVKTGVRREIELAARLKPFL